MSLHLLGLIANNLINFTFLNECLRKQKTKYAIDKNLKETMKR